jgi:hypothetical protein
MNYLFSNSSGSTLLLYLSLSVFFYKGNITICFCKPLSY